MSFHSLLCDYKLPLPENRGEASGVDWGKHSFHTSSLGQGFFEEFSITEQGQIYRETVDREWIPNKNDPLMGDFKETNRKLEKLDWTGELIFDGVYLAKTFDYYMEFTALFFKGDLKEICLGRWQETDNSARVEQSRKFKEALENSKKIADKTTFKIYYLYVRLVRATFGIFRNCLGFLFKSTWALENLLTRFR